ncbi:MAG: hypothetical protein R2822_14020 [Spirosomataceae bacterium]
MNCQIFKPKYDSLRAFYAFNGLEVYVHEDFITTALAAVNILYNVGSRDEDENRMALPTCLNI